MSKFIGRAEPQVCTILSRLLAATLIKPQVSLSELIPTEEYNTLDKEIQQHKFDLVVWRKSKDPLIIVEVNFKHKEKAAKKWRTIFEPLLKRHAHQTLVISDYDCISLFKPADYTKHVNSWDDDIDVINSLKMHNILK